MSKKEEKMLGYTDPEFAAIIREQDETCTGNIGQNFERKHGKAAFDDMMDIVAIVSPSNDYGLSWRMNKLKARTLNVIETAIDDVDRRTSASKLVKGFVSDAFNQYMSDLHNSLWNNGLYRPGSLPIPEPGVSSMRDEE